jgi:hypothetical protein
MIGSKKERLFTELVVVVLLLVGIWLRWRLVVVANLDIDEAYTIGILKDCGFNWMCLVRADPSVPPLQYIWFGVLSLVSKNLIFLRVMNGLIFWVLTYWLGGKICEKYSNKSRLIYLLLAVFSAFQISFSWSAYVYGMMAFWAILAWWLVERCDVVMGRWRGLVVSLVLIMGFLTHYSFVWVIMAFMIWSITKNNNKYRFWAGILLALLGLYVWINRTTLINGYSKFWVEENSRSLSYTWVMMERFITGGYFTDVAKSYSFWPWLLWGILSTVLLIKERGNKIGWWCWLTIAITIVMSCAMTILPFTRPPNQIRTLVPVGYCCLFFISWLFGKEVTGWRGWGFFLMFLCIYLGANIGTYQMLYSQLASDYQGKNAAKIVVSHESCQQKIIVGYFPSWFSQTFSYYIGEYSNNKCQVQDINGYLGCPRRWWVLKSSYYRPDGVWEPDCPVVVDYWRLENEELFLCTSKELSIMRNVLQSTKN